MTDFSTVFDRLRELNRLRAQPPSLERLALERSLDERFGVASRLAVYGTLAPGRSNHDQVAHLGGRWVSGLTARGHLFETEWSGRWGYPALRLEPGGDAVAVELLISDALPAHWKLLDEFEGPGYRRVLTPLLRNGEIAEVANIYEAA